MVISMMVNSLYNIVDSLFVAKMSENAMTALSLVFPIQNLISSIMIGFGIGINAVVSFYLGAGDRKRADKAASQGLFLGTVHGLVFTVIGITVMPWFLRMFTDDSEILSLGVQYTNVAFAFSVALSWELVFEKTFQAVGRMTASMVCMLAGCIVNIILDPVLIFGLGPAPRMGIEGAALATGIGQSVCAIAYIILYILKPISVKYKKEYMIPQKDMCKRLYAIGIPASLSLALPSLLISALNVILAAFSQTYVFVLGVYYKLQTFLYLPANGIVQGMRPLIGYNYGAGEHKRVEEIQNIACSGCFNNGSRYNTLLCISWRAYWFVYNKCGHNKCRTDSTKDNWSGIYSIFCVSCIIRCTGRTWKRWSVTCYFCFKIRCCNNTGSIYIKPYYRSSRSMACILDNRINNSGSIILYICPFKIKINEKESVICVQQQLIRQKIFIWEGHLIMNSHMAKK